MKILIVGLVLIFLGAAGVGTFLIKSYKTPEAIEQLGKEAKPKINKVLVAGKDIGIGQKITPDQLLWIPWKEDALRPQYITVQEEDQEKKRMEEIADSIVRRPITAGEPILPGKLFKRDAPGFMAGMLAPGKRAVSVKVSEETAVSGFIFPGDYVDIALTHDKVRQLLDQRKRSGAKPSAKPQILSYATETVLRHIRVIAIDQQVEQFDKEKKATKAKTVTLELSPKEAEIVITAAAMGRISLVLRSLSDPLDAAAPRTYTTDVEVSPILKNFDKFLAKATKKRPGSFKKKRKAVPVTIFRAGNSTTEKVTGK